VTATLIPLFLELGRLFEERSSLGARAAIDGIRALGARQAVRWRNGAEERVDPDKLSPGEEILVRPGERIAVDGTVLEGRSAVDQSVNHRRVSCTTTSHLAVRSSPEPSPWTGCSKSRCGRRARTPCSGGW
jgi:high-affinity K+ transport system ATPase subunit B